MRVMMNYMSWGHLLKQELVKTYICITHYNTIEIIEIWTPGYSPAPAPAATPRKALQTSPSASFQCGLSSGQLTLVEQLRVVLGAHESHGYILESWELWAGRKSADPSLRQGERIRERVMKCKGFRTKGQKEKNRRKGTKQKTRNRTRKTKNRKKGKEKNRKKGKSRVEWNKKQEN